MNPAGPQNGRMFAFVPASAWSMRGLLQALSLLPQGCGDAAPGQADCRAPGSQPSCFPHHRNSVQARERGSPGLGPGLVSAPVPPPAGGEPQSHRVSLSGLHSWEVDTAVSLEEGWVPLPR